ncbi:helix-turn-helix domain-containing protein [Aliidiomarina sanyensis]|uniref:HTH cro/C1-type domain-containing protein n=1 Tax=Aliidiomarina sanyensis TaxID=1249555 RepID=A0A432WKC6_9GAMM|nr:helix-turn-helix transcriptional regulator [Aliidiomarina sanyensis]RUO34282.1 hypothetical protein CWE11_06035 [Aliidiomarina sanyensis]
MADFNFSPLVIERALETIKMTLKERGLSYTDVAERFQVSLNTVKRMLNGDDISLQRLLSLAEMCDLDVATLLRSATSGHAPHQYFTDEQDEAFAEHPDLMVLFSALRYQQNTPEQVAREQGWNPATLYQKLRQLENIGLIALEPENRFRFLVHGPLGFRPHSRVLRQQARDYFKRAEDALIRGEKPKDMMIILKPLRLPPGVYAQLSEELKRIIDKYAEASELMFHAEHKMPEYQVTIVGQPLNEVHSFDNQ